MRLAIEIFFLFLINTYLFGQDIDLKKTSIPIYADAIISVKTPQGNIKELISQIGLQNKGIPAIDANGLAMETNIPEINATRVKLGIFLFALNNYFDDATETQLTVKVESQIVTIKGQKIKDKKKTALVKSNEEFSLLTYAKNGSVTEMLSANVLDEIIQKVKTQYEIEFLSYYEEKTEKEIYLYGAQTNIKMLERVLNKIEKKWQLDKNLKFMDILNTAIQEEKTETIETKIKEIETTTEVYTLHKNNAFENLNTTKGSQKDLLTEIETLKKQISENNARVKKLTAELEKLKKQKAEK